MKALILSSLLAGPFVAGVAGAAQPPGERTAGGEFGIDVVYQFSTDLDFEGGSRMSVDDDFGLAIRFGYRFNERLELQFSLDWQTIDYDATLQSALLPNQQISISGDLESFTPRMNVVYNFMSGDITPFVSAGIGWSFVDTNIPNSRVQVGCWWDPWYGQICTPYQSTKSVDDFAYQAGLGVRWDFAQDYTLRLSYEKLWWDYNKATSTPDFDQIKLGFAYRY